MEAAALARSLRPDLVVLDNVMPGRSGLAVLAEVGAERELAATPVLMLTASARDGDRAQASEFGVQAYLAKPFGIDDLVAAVDDLLGRGG